MENYVSGNYTIRELYLQDHLFGSSLNCNTGYNEYIHDVNGRILRYFEDDAVWGVVSSSCGGTRYTEGGAGSHPFVATAAEWDCKIGGMNPATVKCVEYAEVQECGSGTYSDTGVGLNGVCDPCPSSLASSVPGASSVSDCKDPATCRRVNVEGCKGADVYDQVAGSYTVFEGECEGKIEGSASYKRAGAETFLWATEAYAVGDDTEYKDVWVLSSSCGSSDGSIAFGGQSPVSVSPSHPFVDVDSLWDCGGADEPSIFDVYCEAFEGGAAECIGGTWSETGMDCADCPGDRPTSEQGATSEDECEFCPPGSEAVDGNCLQCQAGSATSGGGVACEPCEAGSKAGVLLGAESCEVCQGGGYSNVGEQECVMCDFGEYSSAGAGACEQCPADRPVSSAGSTAETDCEADCVRLNVLEGCAGTSKEEKVTGHYRKYEVDCRNTDGRDSWINEVTGYFIFWASGASQSWKFGPVCGGDGIVAYGDGGLYPYLQSTQDTDSWRCIDPGGWGGYSFIIGCSIHQDEIVPCLGGTYDPSGSGVEGACTTCPPQLEISPENSTSVEDCYTAGTNLFVASEKASSIVSFNGNSASFDLVKEGGALRKMGAMTFVTETLFLVVSDVITGIVTMMNVEGEVLGEFARVEAALGLLYLPDRRQVVITGAWNANQIFFFDLDDYKEGVRLEESDAAHVIYLDTVATGITDMEWVDGEIIGVPGEWVEVHVLPGSPRHLSVGENDDEILVTTSEGEVIRLCVPGSGCKPAVRNKILVQANGNLRGVAFSKLLGEFFYVREVLGRVSRCFKSETASIGYECPTFAENPQGRAWDPHGAIVDDVKQVVYVSDMEFSSVHVFALDGTYLGPLEQTRGFLSQPTTMAIKPGPYAPVSSLAVLATAVAGEEIAIPLTLRTSMADIYAATNETNRFQVSAAGFQLGVASTITGYIAHANSLLSAFLSIRAVGKWSVAITEGIKNPQHLEGSPFEMEITAAETDPAECQAEFEKVLTAGDEFALNIAAMDAFGNPTEGVEFEFSCCVGEAMTQAGEYKVSVTPAIKGSPFHFNILSATADAALSSHNIKADQVYDNTETALELRAFPSDKFGNVVTIAEGYGVRVDGGGEIALQAPLYLHKHEIESGWVGEIELSFTLDGEDIQNSPVTVRFVSDAVTATDLALLAGLLVAAIGITVIVVKFSNKNIEFEDEKALTSDEQLKTECNTIIQGQQGWLCFELVDAFSDIANGVMVVQEGTMNPTFLVLFIIVGVFSVFAGINAIVKRGQVINGVRKIRDGDEETMKKFRDGAKGGIITVDNPLLQWALVTLEIHVSALAATNGVVEDFPSLVLNVVSLVMQFNHPDFKTSPQFYMSFGALLVSCITGGRKTYLRDKLKALRAKKGELEAEIKKMSGGRKMSVVGDSLKLIEQLDVEAGELRGAEGVGKSARVVPVVGGEEIRGVEGESLEAKVERLEREKGAAEAREKEVERDLKATREELEALKKNV